MTHTCQEQGEEEWRRGGKGGGGGGGEEKRGEGREGKKRNKRRKGGERKDRECAMRGEGKGEVTGREDRSNKNYVHFNMPCVHMGHPTTEYATHPYRRVEGGGLTV